MAQHSAKIYTRSGDRGQTRLLTGQTVGKDDARVRTYGALDELQSHLGLARTALDEETSGSIVYAVQKELFVAGAELASTPDMAGALKSRIGLPNVARLEAWIDEMSEQYGMPTGFVVPGASFGSAALHVARSVCRRVERLVVQLNRTTEAHAVLVTYFNRLSDLLFMLAWAAQVRAAVEQVVDEYRYKPRADTD